MTTETYSETNTKRQGLVFSNTNQSALAVIDFKEPLKVVLDHPIPKLGDYDILVNNKAIGLNPIDWKGKKYGFGIYHFPWINGRESSGVIVERGKNVDEFEVGDRVMISSTSYRDNRTSTFQQYTAIDSRLVWKLPDSFSFEDGATVGVGLVTAGVLLYNSFEIYLNEKKEANTKATILLWGGATVVGLYVTQLAKIHGLKVISIASLENEQYIKSLGVDVVIDRHLHASEISKKVFEVAKNGIDYGIDCVSKETSTVVIDILNKSSSNLKNARPVFAGIVSIPKYVPENISHKAVIIKKFHEDISFGKSLVDITTSYLNAGKIQPVRYRSYNGGLHTIDGALKELELLGAKAEKYVVSIKG